VVTYHKINEYAAAVGAAGKIDPVIALWVPFIAFAALILWMYHVIAHIPGGQPIGALEKAAEQIGKQFKKLVRFGRKPRLVAQGA
jgi:lipopolysaccharide export system permease protein